MILSASTHEQIRDEIKHYPQARGALLYALHLARADKGALDAAIFDELAEIFALRPIEVAEVASFYPMFNQPRAQAILQVCTNLPCCLRGARKIVTGLEDQLGIKSGTATPDGRFALVEVECLGSCATGPVIQVNRNPFLENVTPDYAAGLAHSPEGAVAAQRPAPIISTVPAGVEGYLLPPDGERWLTLEDYVRHGGFQAIEKAGKMAPKDLAALVKDAGLRGRGGAGFPTGMKWSFMAQPDGGPRYLAVNADESEPGTFKDRQIMERNPYVFLEGVMIAGRGIDANAAFIYIRGEYVEAYRIVREAIGILYNQGILGDSAVGFGRRAALPTPSAPYLTANPAGDDIWSYCVAQWGIVVLPAVDSPQMCGSRYRQRRYRDNRCGQL